VQMAPRDGSTAEQTKSATLLRYLKIFRDFDLSGDGSVSPSEMKSALEADGILLSDKEFQSFMEEVGADCNADLNFAEFCELAKKLFGAHVKNKTKMARIPRAYLAPAQFDQYVTLFREHAGEDGDLDTSELQDFFKKYGISVSAERLQGIMAEVDDDGSGTLGETEFLILLVKALGLKKRKIGPGQCDLKMLREETWSMIEIKRVGYQCKDFVECGYTIEELLPLFSKLEFNRAGVVFPDMIAAGWDCAKAKECGYSLAEMVQAGCSVQRIRDAGFDDFNAAVSLRKNGTSAVTMRTGGWPLSELKKAGYSATELRLAGFSTLAVGAMQQLVASHAESQDTTALREENRSPSQ